MSTAIEFRAVRQASGTVDTDLFDVRPLRDAFNRFNRGANLSFFDSDGTKKNDYPYGQRVEVQYSTDGGSSWTERFEGWVVESTRTTKDGLPHLRVNVVGHDHLLRRRTVEKDYSSTTKTNILNDLITTFTSITWNASNVDIQDDSSIDLNLRGDKVDTAIDRVVSRSADEEYGVNNSLEFFARQQSTSRSPAITDPEVIRHDLPEAGLKAINRYSVYYGSSLNNLVTREDREAQQDLKDKLGTSSNVVIADSDGFPEISSEAVAAAIAGERLGERTVIQTGTITLPLGRLGTSAGDVVSLSIGDAGISSQDFRIAQIDYDWQKGETELVIARQQQGDINDLLSSLSDGLQNVRLQDADPDASEVRYLELQSGCTVTTTATLTSESLGSGFVFGQSQFGQGTSDKLGGEITGQSSVSIESKKSTVSLLNLLRDLAQDGNSAWTDLTHIGVGTDDSEATKADSSLESSVDRVGVEKFGAGGAAEKFEFTATIPAGGVFGDSGSLKELGVFDADSGGNLYNRVTFADTSLDSSTRLKIHLVLEIDTDSNEQGVITSKGQERMRDLVIGESNHEPSDVLYGTGTTDAAESDTSLGSKQHEDTIDANVDRDPGVVEFQERTTSGEDDTSNWSEIGEENSSDELLSRVVFEALPSDFTLETRHRWKFRNA